MQLVVPAKFSFRVDLFLDAGIYRATLNSVGQKLAHKSSSEFFFFGSAKNRKNRARSASERELDLFPLQEIAPSDAILAHGPTTGTGNEKQMTF